MAEMDLRKLSEEDLERFREFRDAVHAVAPLLQALGARLADRSADDSDEVREVFASPEFERLCRILPPELMKLLVEQAEREQILPPQVRTLFVMALSRARTVHRR
jgi:hypothetical protein